MTTHQRFYSRFGALCAVLALGGCAVQPPPETPEVVAEALPETTEVRTEWSGEAEDSGNVDDGWLAGFDDPQLDALAAEALDNNLNLRIAAAQVDRAAGLARAAGAALKPAVGFAGDIAETGGDALASGTSYGASLAVSWEIDVWGRVRAGARAGEAALQATVADYEYARQSLVASTAKTWFLATEAKLQRALIEEAVATFREILEVVEVKQEVGQVTMKDVSLARADLASAEEALRQAQSAYQQVQRGLEVLLGRYPGADLEAADDLVGVPPPVPVGLPSNIVARRPDLIAAERRVATAFLLQQQAELARLPSFNLTAAAGVDSGLNDAIGSLAAGVVAPIFTGGALKAQIETATADQQAAIAAYGQTLLAAFEEVETALSNEGLFEDRQRFLERVVGENEKALEIAQLQYEVGKIDLLSVLQLQARVIGARTSLIRVRNERLAQRVNLHLALGGSFEETG